jgi:Folliculin-interacting protein middle domain/Folliculin-interacting protein C-terminus
VLCVCVCVCVCVCAHVLGLIPTDHKHANIQPNLPTFAQPPSLLSTLLTAVLSENLSWLHTVTPDHQHQGTLTEHLPQCPYAFENSIVTSALRSLYGAECACALYAEELKEHSDPDTELRGVRRLTRTVLVGESAPQCEHLLRVVSYFVRSPLLMLSENPFLSWHEEHAQTDRIRSPVSRPRTVLSSQRNLDRLLHLVTSSPHSDSLTLQVSSPSSAGTGATASASTSHSAASRHRHHTIHTNVNPHANTHVQAHTRMHSSTNPPPSSSSSTFSSLTQPLPRVEKGSAGTLMDSSEFSSDAVIAASSAARRSSATAAGGLSPSASSSTLSSTPACVASPVVSPVDDPVLARKRIQDIRQRLESETLLTHLQAVGFPDRAHIEDLTRTYHSRVPPLPSGGASVSGMLFGGYSRSGYVPDLVTLAMPPPPPEESSPASANGTHLPGLGLRASTLRVRDLLSRDLRLWANRPFLPQHTPDLTSAVLVDVDANRCVLVSQAAGMPAARYAGTRAVHSSRLIRELVAGVVGLLQAGADDQLVLMFVEDRLRNVMRRAALLRALALEQRGAVCGVGELDPGAADTMTTSTAAAAPAAAAPAAPAAPAPPPFSSESYRSRLAVLIGTHLDDMILLRNIVRFFDRTLLC